MLQEVNKVVKTITFSTIKAIKGTSKDRIKVSKVDFNAITIKDYLKEDTYKAFNAITVKGIMETQIITKEDTNEAIQKTINLKVSIYGTIKRQTCSL